MVKYEQKMKTFTIKTLLKIFSGLFCTGPNEITPIDFVETGESCDDVNGCRCVTRGEGCSSMPCQANGRNGICVGKSILQSSKLAIEEKNILINLYIFT